MKQLLLYLSLLAFVEVRGTRNFNAFVCHERWRRHRNKTIKAIMKKYLFPFFLFLLASCNSQNATITIYNKANTNTDSLYFRHLNKTFEFVVKPGEKKSITVDISGAKNIGEGGLMAGLFSGGKMFPILFCRRQLSPFDEDDNVTYFFPNATREFETAPVKPTEFDFFLKNLSGEKIDSIKCDAQYKENNRFTDSLTKMYLKFEEFSKKPEIHVYQNGKRYTVIVNHPWDIWNYRSCTYNFFKGGIAIKDSGSVIGKR